MENPRVLKRGRRRKRGPGEGGEKKEEEQLKDQMEEFFSFKLAVDLGVLSLDVHGFLEAETVGVPVARDHFHFKIRLAFFTVPIDG